MTTTTTETSRLAAVEAELAQAKRGGKELGKSVAVLMDLIKDAYRRGADDPIDALHMLGNCLAEVFEDEGGLSADDHNRVYRALEDRRKAEAATDRVIKLHNPFKVYDECGHKHEETDEGVTTVEDIGFVCEAGLMYTACSHCCTSYGDQTEECATYHDHTSHICETRAVLVGEDWVKRPTKVGALMTAPTRWSDAVAPGGEVCAVPTPDRPDGICGMPVESDAIEARAAHLYEYIDQPEEADVLAGTDVPALVAEVKQLREEIGRARDALTDYGRTAMDVSGDLEDGINAEHLLATAEREGADDCGCTYCRAFGSHSVADQRPLTDNERAFQDGA